MDYIFAALELLNILFIPEALIIGLFAGIVFFILYYIYGLRQLRKFQKEEFYRKHITSA